MKKKIAIINQRYGKEVNGGSEYYTKKLAEHLQETYDIEVLTTSARDYDTWTNYYQEGLQVIDGVRVRRFAVKQPRNILFFKLINKFVRTFPGLWKILEPLWVKTQGPYCPDLIHYIKEKKDYYDVFIFVTYLYYTTVMGLPEVEEKAILVPTAHDEYCIYFQTYKKIFTKTKGIVYLTEEEKIMVEQIFDNSYVPNVIAGTGIELELSVDSIVRERYKIFDEYLIYVGRVDTSKKCDELFRLFSLFKKKHPSNLKLIVIGKVMMEVSIGEKDIVCLGFISEEEKNSILSNARCLVMPSEHESLSLAVLEALALGVPVIVNGLCEVLKGHCQKSKAGLWYENENEFEECLLKILNDGEEYNKMKIMGKKYVEKNYSWDGTMNNYIKLIEG